MTAYNAIFAFFWAVIPKDAGEADLSLGTGNFLSEWGITWAWSYLVDFVIERRGVEESVDDEAYCPGIGLFWFWEAE